MVNNCINELRREIGHFRGLKDDGRLCQTIQSNSFEFAISDHGTSEIDNSALLVWFLGLFPASLCSVFYYADTTVRE